MSLLGNLVTLAVSGTLLAACGSSSVPAVATPRATAATAAPTPAPTPTPDVRAIAAQQYLAAVTAFNTAIDTANAAYAKVPNSAPWSALVPATRTLYTAGTAEEQAVFAIHFPPDMASDVSALVSATNSVLTTMSAFIQSPSQSTWTTYNNAGTASGSASNVIRHDLGLPPVPLGTP